MHADELTHHIDALLCITSNSSDHANALMALELGIAALVVVVREEEEAVNQPVGPTKTKTMTRLDAFLSLQDRFEWNITTVLMHWLGRSIVVLTQPAIEQLGTFGDTDLLRSNFIRCLALLQGLLLMHRPSQGLFVRRSAVQSLLAVVDLSRPSHVSSPLVSHPPVSPSPLHFPSPSTSHHQPSTPKTPASSLCSSTAVRNSNNAKNDPSQLSLAALEALLCALVDRPENMRTFEEVGGLATIVKVLKDKTVEQSVRIKVIELLYYFLLPEQEPNTNTTETPPSSSTKGIERRPQTPPPMTSTPTKAHPSFLLPREDRFAHASQGFVPQTPIKAARFTMRRRRASGGDGGEAGEEIHTSDEEEEREEEEDDRTPRKTKANNANGRTIRPASRPGKVLERNSVTRTTKEKKEMLRKVMPNVDALEERFKAMGLGLGLG